jgi:hypothetical protein
METTRLIKKVKALKSKTGQEAELAELEAQRQLLAVSYLTLTMFTGLN